MTTGWQTDENPSEQMTVADELEHVLFFMTDVLYKAMPPFYEDLENAATRVYGDEGSQLQVPQMIRFASWVGGDMDGNPNVNAKTIRSTLCPAALPDSRSVLQGMCHAFGKTESVETSYRRR